LEIEFKWGKKSTRTTSGVIPTEETPHVIKIATIDELSPGKVIENPEESRSFKSL